MVDVLCCALGCVILLWLVQMRQEQEKSALAEERLKALNTATAEVDKRDTQVGQLDSLLKILQAKYDSLESQYDAAKKRWPTSHSRKTRRPCGLPSWTRT